MKNILVGIIIGIVISSTFVWAQSAFFIQDSGGDELLISSGGAVSTTF